MASPLNEALHRRELGETGADSDGDGQTDFEETLSGTDPRSATSRFEIEAIRTIKGLEGLTSILTFHTKGGRRYRVLHAEALDDESWTARPDWIMGSGETVSIPIPVKGGLRFYRVEVERRP